MTDTGNEALRAGFEKWYVESQNATLGSRDCAMAWLGWQAGAADARAEENEACWKLALDMRPYGKRGEIEERIAEAIRAREQRSGR